ncbi:MAG: aminotransferase class V-fold PLP-dependent enzyme [Peptostreptococcaceae bacterium]
MDNYRNLFAGIDEKIKLEDGSYVTPINFDNGATTPPLNSVVRLIEDNIKNYGPIARGVGIKGEYCTDLFEKSREDILAFFNLKYNKSHTVIYTKSDTEALNILAKMLIKNKDDIILTTRLEHHANDLPFRMVGKVVYAEVDNLGRVKLEDIEDKLVKYKGKIKLVTITGASNVTGYMLPIHKIAKLAHKYDAKIIVDAAQLVAHKDIDMKGTCEEELIDFLTFSAHKSYAPFGSGAIVGLKKELKDLEPVLVGGGCVAAVCDESTILSGIPSRFEAGTQNFFGVIAMVNALNELQRIGFDNIKEHEAMLKEYLLKEMKKINNLTLYGDCSNIDDRLGVICFNINNMYYEDVGEKMADESGISLRCGKFCAHPYVFRLLEISDDEAYNDMVSGEYKYGMVRASLGLYNTIEEADLFLNKLEAICKNIN